MAKNFKSWPKHWPESLDYPEIPVFELLDQSAKRVPNRIAMIFGGVELTYLELRVLSLRFASALIEMGVKKGDRLAIHLPNCPQFAIAYYGALRVGATFTPLSPLLREREAAHQLNDSGAETLVSLDSLYEGISAIIPDTPVKRVITTSIADCSGTIISTIRPVKKKNIKNTLDMARLLRENEPFEGKVDIDVKEDLAHLAYTGGTTGVSKGVMVTHFNAVVNVLQYLHWPNGSHTEFIDGIMTTVYPPGIVPEEGATQADTEVLIVVTPWYHAMGTIGYLNLPIIGGTTMVVFMKFEPREYLEAIARYGVTMLGGAPQLYIPLINLPDFDEYDLSSIKIASCGAAPLPLKVLDKMLEAFSNGTVREGYGLTEVTMGASSNPPSRAGLRQGSVGMPIFDTELKVVDVETGEDLPPGSEGEICIQGPQLMKGYYNRPEATAEVLKNGWLLTGDIGKEDEDGYFYITDRKKDMIIYKGYNVYPRELEEVVFEYPGVRQCAVVGKPDEAGGEIPVAFIELKEGAEATADQIMEHVNSQVAPYKKIREVTFVDAIPASGAGKVLKRELRERLKNN